MTTPEKIESLKENQVFVFGSNLKGEHGGGAAKLALDKFGAVLGQGEGLQGQSYAFPTLDEAMQKVSIEALTASKNTLYAVAKDNPTKQFLVTKLGCGIAGFTEDEMKAIFIGEKPTNIILPKGWAKVRGYKAFKTGLVCRDMQYEMGKDFYHKEALKICQSGFHFCKNLSDVYSYYTYGSDIVVAEIESEGEVIDEEGGNKSVTDHLRLLRILNAEEASNNKGNGNSGHSNTGDSNTGDSNTGYWNTGNSNTGDSNTGYRNTGYWNTGDSNTGYWNTGNSNTGYWNTGNRNTGYWNTGYWNTGNSNTGYFNSITPEDVLIFNKPCTVREWEEVDKPNFIYFETAKWVSFQDMTDSEKVKYPSAKTCGGYTKVLDYKTAFQESYKKAGENDKALIKKLPNFDKDVFFEISGIKVK